jgi:hypothetical protein
LIESGVVLEAGWESFTVTWRTTVFVPPFEEKAE